ncbi:MAG: hypothetical protein ACLQJR_09180 [Stellaceae bacterium]
MTEPSHKSKRPAITADDKIAYKKKLHEIEATIRGGDNGRCGGSGLIRVACRILDFCKSEDSLRLGYGFPSAKTLAEAEGLGFRQVQRHLGRIQRAASYFVIEPGGRHVANHYWPAIDRAPIHPAWTQERAAKLAARVSDAVPCRPERPTRVVFREICARVGLVPAELPGWEPMAAEHEGFMYAVTDRDSQKPVSRAEIQRGWKITLENAVRGGYCDGAADALALAEVLF